MLDKLTAKKRLDAILYGIAIWALVLLLLTLVAALEMKAQTVSFSVEGGAVISNAAGKPIKGFQALDALVCPGGTTGVVANGLVYQAAVGAGYNPNNPLLVTSVIQQRARLSPWNIAAQAVTLGTMGVVSLGASGIIAMSKAWLTGIAIAHSSADVIVPQLLQFAPTPTVLLATMMDPAKSTSLTPGACSEYTIINTPHKGQPAHAGPIPITGPALTGEVHVAPERLPVVEEVPWDDGSEDLIIQRAHWIQERVHERHKGEVDF